MSDEESEDDYVPVEHAPGPDSTVCEPPEGMTEGRRTLGFVVPNKVKEKLVTTHLVNDWDSETTLCGMIAAHRSINVDLEDVTCSPCLRKLVNDMTLKSIDSQIRSTVTPTKLPIEKPKRVRNVLLHEFKLAGIDYSKASRMNDKFMFECKHCNQGLSVERWVMTNWFNGHNDLKTGLLKPCNVLNGLYEG